MDAALARRLDADMNTLSLRSWGLRQGLRRSRIRPATSLAGVDARIWLTGARAAMRLCIGLASVVAQAQALSVTDDRGITVQLARPPQRVVSLLPSLTESVCALNACERLVGVDRYSDHPAEVRRLPATGGGMDPQIETIVGLRPDVVLIARSSPALSRLESLGLKVLALEPQSHEDVRRVLRTLALMLGQGEAEGEHLWQRLDADLSRAAAELPPERRGWRVYFEVASAPYAAAPTSFIGQTLTRLGLGNVVPTGQGPFPRLNPEWVLRSDPDVLMVSAREAAGLAQRPGWRRLRAVVQGRVCRFDDAQADALVRAGPRLAEAARLMLACIKGLPQ